MEVADQALVAVGGIESAEVVALEILDQRQRQRGLVVEITDDRRDPRPAEALDRPPPALAGR